MRKFGRWLAIFIWLLVLAVPVAPVYAADVFSGACEAAPNATLCQDNDDTQGQTRASNSFYGPDGLLTRVARLMALVVGVASVIFIIIGGFKYVMANGDPSKISSARDTILYALVGSALAAATQSIVVFVLNHL